MKLLTDSKLSSGSNPGALRFPLCHCGLPTLFWETSDKHRTCIWKTIIRLLCLSCTPCSDSCILNISDYHTIKQYPFRPSDMLRSWLNIITLMFLSKPMFSANVVFLVAMSEAVTQSFGHCFPASCWDSLATLVHPFLRISCFELLPPTYPAPLLCSHPGSFISSFPWLLLSALPLTEAFCP